MSASLENRTPIYRGELDERSESKQRRECSLSLCFQPSVFAKWRIRRALYPEGDLNPHSRYGHRILSPACLPFHHPGIKLSCGLAVLQVLQVLRSNIGMEVQIYNKKQLMQLIVKSPDYHLETCNTITLSIAFGSRSDN